MHVCRKLSFLILLFIAGCAATGDQYSSSVDGMSDQQLCTSYLDQYSTLYSTDITALNEDKKQYLINLLNRINIRGLNRETCQLAVLKNS